MKGAVVDVDGTVLRGERAVEGAREGIETLRDAGVRLVFLSNNPTVTSEDLAERLRSAGVDVGEATVLSSASLTARHVGDEYPDARVYVLGESALVESVAECVEVVEEPERATVAVVSLDRGLGYGDIRDAVEAARNADVFLSTDPDAIVPTGDGDIPGTGAVTSAVESAVGREAKTVGKPSSVAATAALDALETSPDDTLFVGDRLNTDVALGEKVGAKTALVRSGVTGEEDVDGSAHEPDEVVETLADLRHLL